MDKFEYRLKKRELSASQAALAKDVIVAILSNPVTSTMAAWAINQAFFQAGFYGDPKTDPIAFKTKESTAQWIASFGLVEAAVVASKSINLPDLATKGLSTLALLK